MIDKNANMLALAISVASVNHVDQIDKGGQPYILHPLRVMNSVTGFELKQIAVLHDVVEDCENITIESLRECGFSERVLLGIECLTKIEGESYEEYLIRVESNVDSIRVKLADLKDNSDITRLKGVTDKDFQRMKKYHKASLRLTQKLNEIKRK